GKIAIEALPRSAFFYRGHYGYQRRIEGRQDRRDRHQALLELGADSSVADLPAGSGVVPQHHTWRERTLLLGARIYRVDALLRVSAASRVEPFFHSPRSRLQGVRDCALHLRWSIKHRRRAEKGQRRVLDSGGGAADEPYYLGGMLRAFATGSLAGRCG